MLKLLPLVITALFATVTQATGLNSVEQMFPRLLLQIDRESIEEKKAELLANMDPKNVFSVSDLLKEDAHPFFGYGSKRGFVIDNVQGKDLVLVRGLTYLFNVNTGVKHDFYFTTSIVGRGAGAVTEGVIGQFTYKGEVLITPTAITPDVMYYQCRNHKYMGGKIYIADKGRESKIKKERIKIVNVGQGKKAKPVTLAQVKQKIQFANMMMGSLSVKKIMAGEDGSEKAAVLVAKSLIKAAEDLAGQSDKLEDALEKANAALRLISGASSKKKKPAMKATEDNQAQKFAELLGNVRNFEASYDQNYERIKKKGKKNIKALDKEKIRQLEEQAQDHAAEGQFVAANKLLMQAQGMIAVVLGSMFESETVVYEKKFKGPKDKYLNEIQVYKSYEELVPIAIEQRNPKKMVRDLMGTFIKKAEKKFLEARAKGSAGKYKEAMVLLREATKDIKRALRVAGVTT